ncbi:MAG: hypothetical protein IT355_01785 [Gemmatimonadaceae bacterium]|nr:hypothetical protein [Gemmatimonadaceae bacterium]
MPITYEVDAVRRRVVAVATGDIRAEDVTAFLASVAQARLIDCTGRLDTTEANILLTADETRRLVPLMARFRAEQGHARSALVAVSDVAFGMARMYATLAAESDPGFMVYRTMADADKWLGWATTPAVHEHG